MKFLLSALTAICSLSLGFGTLAVGVGPASASVIAQTTTTQAAISPDGLPVCC